VLGMTTMPPGGVLWKDEHDAGQADPARTLAAAELLATLHRSTFGDEQLQRRFDAQWPLIQGRLDPYHRTAALANPDVAAVVDEEIERLLATRRCLVHGDFSPKNLIAYPDRMVMLDFEVAHWGDPAFDVAFVLALMMLDGIRHSDGAFARESTGFWKAYEAAAGAAAAEPAAVVAELGCVVLGRIDGKSRLPWMTERVARRGREYAKLLLTDLRTHSVQEALLGCA
jgi:aminoglycoside phosphotransferase (APT) family kinase protein